MHLKVRSVDEIRDGSRGKTVRVSDHDCDVRASLSGLTVVASDEDLIGTGDRAGTPRLIKKTATINFTAEEVKRLVDVALDSGLLAATVSIPRKKK